MTLELLTQNIDVLITRYIAIFCLLTIILWGGGSYLLVEKWAKPVRDSAMYLLCIGIATLFLTLRPEKSDYLLWAPLTWFCFALLLMMELLWLAYLLDGLVQMFRSVTGRLLQRSANEGPVYRTPYSRR